MSTTEKLFVQLFDQKRQIIEELNHQKQLYDKYLLSKLLIQDISPPPWLLNFDSHISTSDLKAFNKEDLLKGLLLPRHGPFTTYPAGPCLVYEKPPILVDNSGIPDETCAIKSASSNGIDEEGAGVAPQCQVDVTEDTAGIAYTCQVDGTEDMDGIDDTEDTAGVVPMCQVDGIDDTAEVDGIGDKAEVDGIGDTVEADGVDSTVEVDGVYAMVEVDGIKDIAVIAPTCQIDSTEDRAVIDHMCQVDSAEDMAGIAPICQVDGTEDMARMSPQCQLGGTEETAGIALPSHVDGIIDTSNYVIMSPEDQTETRLSNACQLEMSHARLQRSKSRQKALELRNSAKTSAKSRLGMENNVDSSFESKIFRDEQLDGFKESLELGKLSALPTKLCSNKEVAIGNSLDNERSGNACGFSLAQSSDSKSKELKSGVSEMEKSSSVYGGRITRSRSSSQQLISTHSGREKYRFDKLLDGSSGSLGLDVPSRLPTEICFKEQGAIESLSDKERSFDAYKASLSHSTINEDKELDIRDSQKTEEHSKIYRNSNTKSRSCQESDGRAPLFANMSDKVCVGRPIRSRNGRTQQSEIDMGNSKPYRITRSTSSGQDSVLEAYLSGKKINEACVGRMTRSRSGKAQLTEIEMGKNKACSGKVTGSRSCEAEESKLRNKSRKESVKPKQLDFDEVEETNLCSVPFPLSDASSSHLKEVSGVNLPEVEAKLNMLLDFKFSHAIDGSWPEYKRRKIEYQNPFKSASPTLRMNPFQDIMENLPGRSAAQAEEANITISSQQLKNSDNSVAALSDRLVLPEEKNQSITSLNKEHELIPQIQCEKYQVASTCEHLKLPKYDGSNARQCRISESSESLPEDGEVKEKPPSAVLISGMVSDGLMNDQEVVDGSSASTLMYTEGAVDQSNSPQRIGGFKFSISPSMEYMNLSEAEKAMPEFEGFIIDDNTVNAQNSQDELVHKEFPFPSSIMDRTSLSEQFCKSTSMSTPVSPFPTACKLYFAPGMYSSVPNGLLENNDVRNNGAQSNLLHSGNALLGKSHSDLFSFPGSHGWDNRKPFLSPMGMAFEGITSKSGGSGKLGNSNPELTCFPILEDPESSAEDVCDTANPGVNRFESTMKNIAVQCENSMAPETAVERMFLKSLSTKVMRNSSSAGDNREPYCDNAMEIESSLALDQAVERHSQGSVSTKISFHEIDVNKKSSMGQGRSKQIRPGKENKGISFGTDNRSKKHSKTRSSRFSKPKLSGQSCLRSRGESRGQSVSEKEQKHNNIVSGIKSFVPIVQQKQAAAAVPEKRDFKVKALQAAEAAKRAADRRENERNQKKEALKLERARAEQEKLKEVELKKKLKEEQKKKREAENAAKKRQREEEERKEKERKKRRIEDARLQLKQAEEKLNAWKEESRCAAEDERAHHEEVSDEKTEKKVDKENEGDSRRLIDPVVVGNDQREADVGRPADDKVSVESSATGKMGNIDMSENSTPSFDRIDKPVSQTTQSYELSPYRDSDDEEEEEDDEMPNKKFVPSWASKTCVISALSSLQYLNPDVIFPPGSFCSMDEVLLPRRLIQK